MLSKKICQHCYENCKAVFIPWDDDFDEAWEKGSVWCIGSLVPASVKENPPCECLYMVEQVVYKE